MAVYLILGSLLALLPFSGANCPICSKNYAATFEDLAAGPAGINGQGVPVPYNALDFANYKAASEAAVPGVVFHTPTYAGAVSTTKTLLDQMPVLTADYPNSKVQSFDLHDFWFGCTLAVEEEANGVPAQACSIQVSGYKLDSLNPVVCNHVGPAQFSFTPGGTRLFGAPMAHAWLDASFRGLVNVTIEVTNAEVADQTTILYSDDYTYTTHETCCPS